MYIEFCQKLNQIIYNMLDTICGPNIMILAQTILQICIWLTRFEMFFFLWDKYHDPTSKKGDNSVKYSKNFTKI